MQSGQAAEQQLFILVKIISFFSVASAKKQKSGPHNRHAAFDMPVLGVARRLRTNVARKEIVQLFTVSKLLHKTTGMN